MFVVYVRHYLTSTGIDYLITQWFPKVQLLMSQQAGYISVLHEKEKDYDEE